MILLRRTAIAHRRELNRILELLSTDLREAKHPGGELDILSLAEQYDAAPDLVSEACVTLARDGLLVPTSPGRWAPAPDSGGPTERDPA